jgi:cell pole-organizing protein PopZ
MKQGQKAAEPRMEDVLASIRRAIDENAASLPPERLGGSMSELRVKFDRPAPPRRVLDYPSAGSRQPSGFAGILSGKRCAAPAPALAPEPMLKEPEAPPREPDPLLSPPAEEGQELYEGYYGAQVADYGESAEEIYEPAPQAEPSRFLPPAPVASHRRQGFAAEERLLSETSSEATQAAFDRLAETLAMRALGERPIGDSTHELLRGMLKQWLDENLPKIVERLVREEIERVVKRPQR